MTGNLKGEVTLQHEGATYRLRIDMNALADIELETDRPALAVVSELQNPETFWAKNARVVFYAGLKQGHPDMTLELAGRILHGNIDSLGKALAAMVPDGGGVGNGKAAVQRARRPA